MFFMMLRNGCHYCNSLECDGTKFFEQIAYYELHLINHTRCDLKKIKNRVHEYYMLIQKYVKLVGNMTILSY